MKVKEEFLLDIISVFQVELLFSVVPVGKIISYKSMFYIKWTN